MRPRLPTLLAILTTLSGCALFLPKLTPPQLAVIGVQVRRADFWSQRLAVRLRVTNPNDRNLPVKGLSYALDIDGQRFANGTSSQSFIVPARGTAEFTTDLTADMTGAVLTILSRGQHRPVHYRLRGKVQLSSGWWRSLPFDERGSFTLK